jgi:DOPA 4,5-dioxygenase
MSTPPRDVAEIRNWHAHVYFDPATRAIAAELRGQVAERFPNARLGRWHEGKVGPHPQAMYQIAFENPDYPALSAFLALNRRGLTILLHPESGRPKEDHLHNALWMGAVLPLDASILDDTD